MTDISLGSIGSGFNLSVLNTNFDEVESVINSDLLHLEGGNNVMRQNLDMNSQRVLNLPAPSSENEPVRNIDLQNAVLEGFDGIVDNITITPTGSTTARSLSSLAADTFNVLNYSSLNVEQTAVLRGADPVTGWVGHSYTDWRPALLAAFQDAASAGGGTVWLPNKGTPYYISDVVGIFGSNITFICEGTIKLGNATTGGGIFGTAPDTENCCIYDLKIDGSNIYTGGSGENGVGFGGTGHRLLGGIIKNCKSGNNNDGTGDGGKGVQNETQFGNIIVDGVTFENCFMAMSTRREYTTQPAAIENGPQIFTNITAENCNILLFVQQSGSPLPANAITGGQHSVVLSNFSAKNCGNFEGVLQFSTASNVLVSNGIISNGGFTTPAFIRGRVRYSRFENLQFAGNCSAVVNCAPGTYAHGLGESTENSYDFSHIGTISTFLGSSATSDRTLTNSTIVAKINTDVSSGLVDTDVKSSTTMCSISYQGKVLKGSTEYISNNIGTFATFSWAGDVLANSEAGSWTPVVLSSSGTITTVGAVSGKYTKIGRLVLLEIDCTITTNGTGAGYILIETDTGATPLPSRLRAPAGSVGYGVDIGVTSKSLIATAANATDIAVVFFDGTYPGANGARLKLSIIYTLAS